VPALPGQDRFSGRVQHLASYRNPDHYAGERVIVVGAGNSAVQVGYELAQVATVSLATAIQSPSIRSARAGMTCITG
jgi:putative flavoprotein involved in K+ transport